jgi:hypothetical protein
MVCSCPESSVTAPKQHWHPAPAIQCCQSLHAHDTARIIPYEQIAESLMSCYILLSGGLNEDPER